MELEEPDLRSYLGVIARRRWLVAVVTLLALGAAVAISLIPNEEFRVKAQVVTTGLNDPVALVFGAPTTPADRDRQASSELAFLSSSRMRLAVATAYNGALDDGHVFNVSVRAVDNDNNNQTSNVVELSLVSTEPAAAASLVNAYANEYVELRQADATERLVTLTDQMEGQVASLEEEIAQLRQPIDELQQQIREGTAGDPEAALAQLQTLQDEIGPQVDPLARQAGDLRSQITDLRFGTELTSVGGPEVLSQAGTPSSSINRQLPLNLAIGLVFGLFLGGLVAFVVDYFDDSVRSKEVVDRVSGVPSLGLIPKFDDAADLVTVERPTAPAAEAFRSLRTAVKFLGVDRQVRVVQVTSPAPEEGKTLVAANLAVAFAEAGDRVVLVGGDLRRPRLDDLLGLPPTPGLTGVLIGDVTLPQAIQTAKTTSNLSVLPSGQPPPNAAELLSGERARRLVEVLGQTYDVVVVDCPPVLPVSDALVVARMVDTTLLVVSPRKTSKRGLTRAVELLHQVDAPLAGTVLNSLSPEATFGAEPYRYETTLSRRRNGRGRDGDGRGPGRHPGEDQGDEDRSWRRRQPEGRDSRITTGELLAMPAAPPAQGRDRRIATGEWPPVPPTPPHQGRDGRATTGEWPPVPQAPPPPPQEPPEPLW